MSRRKPAKASRAAARLQRGHASPALTVRQQAPEPKREPTPTVSTQPITDLQRFMLGDLRRRFNLPRHDIPKLTKAEASAELTELSARRAAEK
jgi:hypothetical protein